MRTITAVIVMLFASVVHAQALAVRTTGQQCTSRGCTQVTGTGACAYVGNVDGRSVYLTAAHVVKDAVTIKIGYGGQWWPAKVVYKQYTDRLDYAIVETQSISAPKCFSLASIQPSDGAEATAYGYSQGIYNMRRLKAKIRVNRNGRYFSRMVAQGDSGGPIIANGMVVGIISAIVPSQGTTVYSDTLRMRGDLIRIYGRMPSCNRPIVVQPSPIQPIPDPITYDNSKQVAALEGKVNSLQKQILLLSQTKIPVWVVDENGDVLKDSEGNEFKEEYLLGDPIKFRLIPVKPKEAK